MRKSLAELEKIWRERIPEDRPGSFRRTVERIDGAALLESSRIHGTPQYFLDLGALRDRASMFIGTMRAHIPGCDPYYAFKCNDLPLLVATLKECGFQADVAGLFELELALRSGFQRILFSGPGKCVEELELALRNRDRVSVIADNMDELRLLRELAGRRKASIGLRLSAGRGDGHGAPWKKFGFELDRLRDAVRFADESPNLEWNGLHFHSSWNKDPRAYVEEIERLAGFLARYVPPERVRRLKFLDVGGGFYPEDQAGLHKGTDRGALLDILRRRLGGDAVPPGAESFDPYAFRVTRVAPLERFAAAIAGALHTSIRPLHPDISVYLEPGRFIATHSTTILLAVTAVKHGCVVVDGGINMLGDYKFSEYSFSPIVNLSRPSGRLVRRTIYGPLCDPSDLWGYSCYGKAPQRGDILAVLHQGAYTFSTAWRFIKPIPPYIAFDAGRYIVAKAGERFEDRYAGCRI